MNLLVFLKKSLHFLMEDLIPVPSAKMIDSIASVYPVQNFDLHWIHFNLKFYSKTLSFKFLNEATKNEIFERRKLINGFVVY